MNIIKSSLYIIFIFTVLSIVANADVVTPNPIGEPGFETVTGWNYTAYDPSDNLYSGFQTTPGLTEGSYKYRFQMSAGTHHYGDYVQISRTVDFTNIRHISYNYSEYDPNGWYSVKIFVDSDQYLMCLELFIQHRYITPETTH